MDRIRAGDSADDSVPCIVRTVGDVSEIKYDILTFELASAAGLTPAASSQMEKWAYELALQCLLYKSSEYGLDKADSNASQSHVSDSSGGQTGAGGNHVDTTLAAIQKLQKAFNLHPHAEAEVRSRTTCLTPQEFVLHVTELLHSQLELHKHEFKESDAFLNWKETQTQRLDEIGSKLSRQREDVVARVRVDVVEGRGFVTRKEVARRFGGLTGFLSNTATVDSSDPFIEIQVGNSPPVKTHVENNTTTPVWNQTYVFDLVLPEDGRDDTPLGELRLTLWHSVAGWPDVRVGTIRIPLPSLKQREYKDEWHAVRDPSDLCSLGEVKIRIAYAPLKFEFQPAPLSVGPLYRILFRKLICLDGIEYVAAPADDALGLIPTSEVTQEGAIFSLAPLTHFSLQSDSKELLDAFASIYCVPPSAVDIVTLEMLIYFGESKRHLDSILTIMKTYVWELFSLPKLQASVFSELKNTIATEFIERLITDCINCFDLGLLSSRDSQDASPVIKAFHSAVSVYRFLYPSSYLPRLQSSLKDRITSRYRKWKTSPSSTVHVRHFLAHQAAIPPRLEFSLQNLTELGVLALMCDRMAEEVDAYFFFLCDPLISDDMKILSRDVANTFAELLSIDLRRHFSYGAASTGTSLVLQQQLQLQHHIARPEAQQHAQEPHYRADAFDLCVRVADLCIQWRDLLPHIDDTLFIQTQIVPFVCTMASNWMESVGSQLFSWAASGPATAAAHTALFGALHAALEYQKPVFSALSIASALPNAFVQSTEATPAGNPISGSVSPASSSPPGHSVLATSPPRTTSTFFSGGANAPSSSFIRSTSKDKSQVVDTAVLLDRFSSLSRRVSAAVVERMFTEFEESCAPNSAAANPADTLLHSLASLDLATRECVSFNEELVDLATALGGVSPPPPMDVVHLEALSKAMEKFAETIVAGFETELKQQLSSASHPTAAAIVGALSKLLDDARACLALQTRRKLSSTLRKRITNLVLDVALREHSTEATPRDFRAFLLEILEPLRKCIAEKDDEVEGRSTSQPDSLSSSLPDAVSMSSSCADADADDDEMLNAVNTVLQCMLKPTQEIIDFYLTLESDSMREYLLKLLRIRAKDAVATEFVSKRRRSLDAKSKPGEVLDDLADAFKKQTDRVRNLFK